jgi:fructokinase
VVFGVILGTGVGGGIAISGQALTGANAVAGEWGHNPLPWPTDAERPGPACYCGRSGCTETFLSGPGLVRDYRAAAAPAEGWPADGEPATAAAVAARADGGDRAALAALDRYAERLARSLAAVVNLLDPEVIVLGGGLSNLDVLYARVPALWQRWIFSDRVATRLVRHRHGDSSGVRGAAWLWPAAPGAAEHRW